MRIVRSLCLAAALACAAVSPAMVHAQPGAAAPASVAKVREVVVNFKLFDILKFGGRKGILTRPEASGASQADQEKLTKLFDEEMEKRRVDTIDIMAKTNSGQYTAEQLDQLVALSKIKYVQDLVLAGADTSLATPDETSMTAAERALFMKLMSETWVVDFFTKFDYSTAAPNIAAAADTALSRFSASR